MQKSIYIMYVAVLIVMGAATLLESSEGTSFVHRHIYGAWWFTAIWAILATSGCVYIIRCKALWRRGGYNLSVLLLHASFAVVLVGALLTHLTGSSGTIHLRLNAPQSIAVIERGGEKYLHRLDFSIELTAFDIIEDEAGGVRDYRSEFRIGDAKGHVSMNNIYRYGSLRFYQMGYDCDGCGSTLMINRDPYGIPVTYCGYALLFFSFSCVAFGKVWVRRAGASLRDGIAVLGVALMLTAAWCVYYFVLDGSWSQIPVLRHPLLVFHVLVIIIAYALLLIQASVSAWALVKRKEQAISVLHPALCLLSIGIFLGAIWANISWGSYWSWDSKETWALITLMVYAIPMHRRSLPVFGRPKVFNIYVVVAFLAVLMTYFGVNHFLTGLHSYA